jgi:hypothetical protein
MPRMPDNSFIASSIDAARQVKQYLRLIESRNFEKFMETCDNDAIAAGEGKPGFAHPGASVLVLCQLLVGVQKRLGRSAIPLVDEYLAQLGERVDKSPELWIPEIKN